MADHAAFRLLLAGAGQSIHLFAWKSDCLVGKFRAVRPWLGCVVCERCKREISLRQSIFLQWRLGVPVRIFSLIYPAHACSSSSLSLSLSHSLGILSTLRRMVVGPYARCKQEVVCRYCRYMYRYRIFIHRSGDIWHASFGSVVQSSIFCKKLAII